MWEFWVGLSIAFTIFFVTSILVCIRRKQKAARNVGYTISDTAAPVVVTSATHTAPGGYPVTQLPPPVYPAGNAYVTSTSYPAQTTSNVTVQMPMPMPQQNQQQMPMPMPGMQTHGVAYPPYPGAGAASMNPPPYDIAMANPGPSVMPAGYEKQAPYNPHFGQ
ncbi:splicing factor-like protein 1 isoform X1 [Drosophila santomea]|uniref:splicing factor-like protein 1 isoform X1 n=1 Tax=Drosophila santomea TaxID=129105 RepID=UPI0019544C23|nr:splicing factor-like protein 1 isoform X1 [Drosophila santomea]